MSGPRARRALGATALGVAATVLTGPTSYAASSALDPTFGVGGVATVGVGTTSLYPQDLARTPDGKVVGVGYTALGGVGDVVVFRLTADGQPDPTFPTRVIDYGTSETAKAVTVQPDGKIVVAGSTSAGVNGAVWRLLPSGEPDRSFSGDGLRPLDSGGDEHLTDVAIAPDGEVVVVGRTSVGPGGGEMTVYRLTSVGEPDATFDSDGALGFGGDAEDHATSVLVQPDGKILVAGVDSSQTSLSVRRLTVTGAPDGTFSTDGTAVVPGVGVGVDALALQPDGSVLASGAVSNGTNLDAVVVRLTPRGDPDLTFGGLTGLHVDAGANERLASLAVLPSGEVAAAGSTSSGSDAIVALSSPGGVLDPSFGPGGVRRLGTGSARVTGLTAQPDGKLLAIGDDGGTVTKAAVYRLLGDATTAPQAGPTCHGRAATIVGTAGRDRLVGTKEADVVVGLGADDVVVGLGGNDLVCAGSGNDTVKGGPGKDRLYGEAGKDKLLGGSGKDRLVGGPDRDVVHPRAT